MFTGKQHVLAASLLTATLLLQPIPKEAALGQAEGKPRVDRYGDPLPRGAVTRLGTVRYRHGGSGVAFLPDSKTVVSVGWANGIIFWDARTGRLLRRIETGKLSLGWTSAFSTGGKRLVVSGSLPSNSKPGWRNVIRVFDTATGKELRTFERKLRDGAHALALTPDGKYLFSLGGEGKLRIEEILTGVELLRQQFPQDNSASLVLSPDGSMVAVSSGSNTRKLFVWKWQTAEGPRELKTSHYRGSSLAFSPNGRLLADCGGLWATLRLWDVKSGRLLHELQPPDHDLHSYSGAAFAPDGKSVAVSASGNQRSMIHFWDPKTGKFLKRLEMGSGALAFSPDGRLLVAGARVWDFAAGKELSANDEAHRGAVAIVLTGPGGVVVTASDDHTVRLWDAATGKQRRCFVHDNWVRAVALSPDGNRLASSSLDDTVCLWDTATGRKIYRLPGHGQLGGRRAVTFTPDGKSFLSWGDDMYLRQWDVRTGKALLEHALRPTGVQVPDENQPGRSSLSMFLGDGRFSPDGKYFVLQVGRDCFVFDTATGKELRKFSATISGSSLTISPSGELLTITSSKLIAWRDLATGKRRNNFPLAGPVPDSLALAPNGRFLAVGKWQPGAPIRLIEVASGREVRKFDGFRGRVRSLAFLPDGKRLVSGMENGTALIWDLTH